MMSKLTTLEQKRIQLFFHYRCYRLKLIYVGTPCLVLNSVKIVSSVLIT